MPCRLLLASSSRCHPYDYLDHCESEILRLFEGLEKILFVPFARPGGISHDEYTRIARERFARMSKQIVGIHEFADAADGISDCDGVFIGGGNTFLLLQDLYAGHLIAPLRERLNTGMPYLGTSAGSNVAGMTIGTSNDMPIVHPPTFDALGVVPFNLNPHLPRTPQDPTHKGETREDRIKEFHVQNAQPVVGLFEDGMLRVEDNKVTLIGKSAAVVFRRDREAERIAPETVWDLPSLS